MMQQHMLLLQPASAAHLHLAQARRGLPAVQP
jgi:hypothetical protein